MPNWRGGGEVAVPAPVAVNKGVRRILLDDATGYVQAQILDRAGMRPGDVVHGPAIVEQGDTTTLVEPGWSGEVAANHVLILKREHEA